jgi:hypothetical protein
VHTEQSELPKGHVQTGSAGFSDINTAKDLRVILTDGHKKSTGLSLPKIPKKYLNQISLKQETRARYRGLVREKTRGGRHLGRTWRE